MISYWDTYYASFVLSLGGDSLTACLKGLKVLDNSVESFASGAWSALGSAWKGGSSLVSKYAISFLCPLCSTSLNMLYFKLRNTLAK